MSTAEVVISAAVAAAPIGVKSNISRRENGQSTCYSQLPVFFAFADPNQGKNWHPTRTAFRPTSFLTPYAKRKAADQARAATKARECELRREKQEAKEEVVRRIKEKREKKEEKQRFEEMEARMHRKRVERLRRREKRNKALKS